MNHISRRIFLKQGAMTCVCLGAGAMFGSRFLQQSAYAADLGSALDNKILICIFQRGAVDGLSMVVPYGDPFYYKNRAEIALGAPGRSAKENATLDLDGYFGLHPALADLLPIFQSGHLAAIQACGSPNASRSHFDSQDLMEAGVEVDKSVADGWLNRALGYCPEDAAKASPFRATAMTSMTPRTLMGDQDTLVVRDLDTFGLAGDVALPMPAMGGMGGGKGGFESMYSSAVDTVLHGTAQESFDAISMLKAIRGKKYEPAGGAKYPNDRFGRSLRQIAQLIKSNVGLQVAFAEIEGWDTHANQGNATGTLAQRLTSFGQGLAALHRDLGDRMNDVVVVTQSEFGRTVRQNGNRGTDHGHGTCFFVLGGPIAGGKVYGDWPTLAPDKLFENRDLAVTTDYRDVFAEVATRHLRVPLSGMPQVFPKYAIKPANFRNFYRA